jgi:hypothetical protein
MPRSQLQLYEQAVAELLKRDDAAALRDWWERLGGAGLTHLPLPWASAFNATAKDTGRLERACLICGVLFTIRDGRAHRREYCDTCGPRRRNGWRGPADLVHGHCGCGAALIGRSDQVRCAKCSNRERQRRHRARKRAAA